MQLPGSKKVIVSQKGFHRELVNKYADDIKTVRPRKTSCDPSITEDPSDNDPESSKEKYAGAVMSLMWLARLTRCDIAFADNVCSRRFKQPTVQCWKHTIKILSYLERTGAYRIVYEKVERPIFTLSYDASYQMVILRWDSGALCLHSKAIRLMRDLLWRCPSIIWCLKLECVVMGR